MQPALTLSYSSSRRSDSWVGYGWTLDVGAISRSLKEGVPAYDGTDRFMFGGEELVDLGGGAYEFRRRSFLRIRRVSWNPTSAVWELDPAGDTWEVRTKGGEALRFGTTPNSRIVNGSGETFAWLLAEREDPLGNALGVSYDHRDSGTAYPAEIRYTLRSDGSGSLLSLNGAAPPQAVDRVIEFALEPRPDPSVRYSAGFESRLEHRLARVDTHVGGEVVRRYEMGYEASPDSARSLLREVRDVGALIGGQTQGTPRVNTFTYHSNADEGTQGWQIASGFDLPADVWFTKQDRQDGETRLGDVNADGLIDLIRQDGTFLNTGTGFVFDATYALPDREDVEQHTVKGGVFVDLNADGRADFLHISSRLESLQRSLFEYWVNSGSGWTLGQREVTVDTPDPGGLTQFQFEWVFLASRLQARANLADLNGDGRPDLLRKEKFEILGTPATDHESYALNRADGSGFDGPFSGGYETCTSGCTELVHTQILIDCPTPPACSSAGFSSDPGRRSVDVNADGLADLVSGSGAYLNEGAGNYVAAPEWVSPVSFTSAAAWSPDPRDNGVRITDVNGDGRPDLLRLREGDPPEVWLNSGVPTAPWVGDGPASPWAPPLPFVQDDGRDLGLRLLDLDGDGMVDLLLLDEERGARVYLNRASTPDLLRTATNSFGATTRFHYATSPPEAGVPWIMRVVESIEVDDGLGMTSTHTYAYSEPFYDTSDRVFQGFGRVAVTDPYGTVTTTEFHVGELVTDPQGFALAARPKRKTVEAPPIEGGSNVPWHETTYSYVPFDADGNAALPHVALPWTTTEVEYDGDPSPSSRIRTVEFRFDDYDPSVPGSGQIGLGNRTVEIRTGDATTPDRVVERTYAAPNLTRYIVDRVAIEERRAAIGSGPVLERTRFFYDDEEFDPLAVPSEGLLTKIERWLDEPGAEYLAEQFSYDSWGNLITSTDPRGNSTTFEVDSTYHAFPTAVINPLLHRTEMDYTDGTGTCGVDWPVGAGYVHAETDVWSCPVWVDISRSVECS